MRSHRSRNSGAGGLCDVRMALTPIDAKQREATFPHAFRHGGAKSAGVVVQVHAVQLDATTVQQEAAVLVEGNRANAERRGHDVDRLGAVEHFRPKCIEVRLRYRPQSRRCDVKLLLQLQSLARGQRERRVDAGDFAARVVENDRAKRAAARGGPIILDLCAHDHIRARGIRARRRHVRPPVRHVQRVGERQPHVAIDAAPRIPAGVGLARVVDAHRHHVHAGHEVMRDVIREADVTVWPLARGGRR